MIRILVGIVLALGGCANNAVPQPNSVQVRFESRDQAVQVLVSNVQPMIGADLIGADGRRFPAAAVTLVSGPHVDYNPPPSVGIGIGGFGFGGCCSGFGTGIGVAAPPGGPTPARMTDQYITSAVISVAADYAQNWGSYRVEVHFETYPLVVPAPAPG